MAPKHHNGIAWALASVASLLATSCFGLEPQGQAELQRSQVNPSIYDNFWIQPFQMPDALTYPCQDFKQVEGALNSFREANGVLPLIYTTEFETQSVSLLAAADSSMCSATPSSQPSIWADALNGTAIGLGWRATGRKKRSLSYKCVQAVNFWANSPGLNITDAKAMLSEQWFAPGGPASWAALMWSNVTEAGCAVRLCSEKDDPAKGVQAYVVYCLLSPVTMRLDETAELRQQLPSPDDAAECVPMVHLTNTTDSVESLMDQYASRGLTPSRLFCYNNQMSPAELQTAGVPLAIPCKDAKVPDRCPEWDLYSKGTAPGSCPTTYRSLPGDTFESIAEQFEGLTADDLCCYNHVFNTSEYGYCGQAPYMAGVASILLIPCAVELEHRNCDGPSVDQGVLPCPDTEDAMDGLNELRIAYGLTPLEWDAQLADDVLTALNVSLSDFCNDPMAMFNETLVPPSVTTLVSWTVNNRGSTTTSPTCAPDLIYNMGQSTQLMEYLQYNKWPDAQMSEAIQGWAMLQAAWISPNATSIGCAIQVCDPYKMSTTCTLDVPLESIFAITGIADLAELPERPDCPRIGLLLEGDTYGSVAARNNLTEQEVVCFHGYAKNAANSMTFWSLGMPVVLPCPAADPSTVTCDAWEVLQGERSRGKYCGFNRTAEPGESFDSIVSSLPELGYGACQLCCFSGSNGTCRLDVGDEIYIPCRAELPEYDASTCACLAEEEEITDGRNTDGLQADSSSLGLILGLTLGGATAVVLLLIMAAALVIRRRRHANEIIRRKKDLEKARGATWKGLADYSWVLQYDQLQIKGKIGGGSFGNVYLASLHDAPVAVKCIKEEVMVLEEPGNDVDADRQVRALAREVQLMTQVHSPYTVLFLGVCLKPLACVTEYCAQGSLHDLLNKAFLNPDLYASLTWDKRLKMMLHAALGMSNLHANEIVHRDLKSPNLMVDEHFQVKVGDFGLSVLELAPEGGAGASTIMHLNRRWMAPEVAAMLVSGDHQRQPFTKASDVYAFGLVLLEMLTLQMPFKHLSNAQVFVEASQGTLCPSVPEPEEIRAPSDFVCMTDYINLMTSCWARDPEERPTFDRVAKCIRYMLKLMRESRDPGLLGVASSMESSGLGGSHSSSPTTPHEPVTLDEEILQSAPNERRSLGCPTGSSSRSSSSSPQGTSDGQGNKHELPPLSHQPPTE